MTRPWIALAGPLAALAACLTAARGEEPITVLPAAIALSSPESRQRLIVQEIERGEPGRQVVEGIAWSSSAPEVVAVADGLATPVADGRATITAKVGDRVATVEVAVSGQGRAFDWSFREHVQPILAKRGCNAGACHGALAGKGGFRLSLQGYDPDADFFNIVKQDRGRRVEFGDPGRSLILTKPSGAIAHKGGLRFATDSLDYRILSGWIAAGSPPPTADDARVESLEVSPERSLQRVGRSQQILVRARYSNGRTEDVTRWVKWSSSDESVCRVDEQGKAQVVGPGEGAVVAWFASKLAIARITVPYGGRSATPPDQLAQDRKPRNFIDEQIDRQLARLDLPASPPCDDAEFLRRATIDTIGRIPTVDEARAFLADPSEARRDAVVDRLLAAPEFVDYWTYKWSDLLMLNGARLRPQALKAYYQWIRKQVADGVPWDRFVREIVTASGESVENGATNFYALSQSPEDMTENVSQAFLGLSLGCAKCHNHPLEKWTNDQYYGMASLFSRVRAKGWGGEGRQGDGLRTLYVAESGELVQPRTGKPQPPTPLDGRPLDFDDPADRRAELARWLTAPENPYFARSITNRVWANFFGVGLVESVDDMRVTNPASDETMLAAAAAFVVENKFDLKALMREILRSNAYQRSSDPLPGNAADRRSYSRSYPRRMMAEVLHDAVVQVTEVPTAFEFIGFPGGDREKTDFYPLGTRAIQLYDAAVENYFLQAFGRNARRIVCECERSDEPTMVQVLHLANGSTLNEKLRAPGNRLQKLIRLRREGMSSAALIDELYLSCLSRYPRASERDALLALLPAPGDPSEAEVVEDLFWGVMSSREFLFNH
ncbi:DUF1549 domain-containing protein [Planctomyces sp. SH-PL62]|uniref:DUF1549 domain-containing protein n=1 Tax=Planctomyces sp. SH-PL62 TaxID=1636152 RepID=UPI00078E4A97|nr:DUF1549 domain-containing protein [Planctomyces sp. SH-PL62]AMV38274.1 Bacterial Ig-like domain (group 2) [Planctomyces sp. SH-PL62]